MSNEMKMRFDQERRALLIATGAAASNPLVSTVGTMVSSLQPSERAKAAGAPVEVDIGAPAPDNLPVPRHMFASDTRIIIGKDEQGEA